MKLSLQHRVRIALGMIQFGGGSLGLAGATLHPGMFLPALTWIGCSEPWIRTKILPKLFPTFVCYRCHTEQSLEGLWKCGDHFLHSEPCHFFNALCPKHHRLNQFDCPECGATIVVLHRYNKYYHAGKAIELKSLKKVAKGAPTSGIHIGDDMQGQPLLLPQKYLGTHVFEVGSSGSGKSNTLGVLSLKAIRAGYGLTLLDPGNDLCENLHAQIPQDRQEHVVYASLLDPYRPLQIDLLEHRTPDERATVISETLDMFQKMFAYAWGPNIRRVMLMGLLAITEQGGTIENLYDLCSDKTKRIVIAARLSDQRLKAFWSRKENEIGKTTLLSVSSKLEELLFHPVLGKILSCRENCFDAREVINTGKILLLNLHSGNASQDLATMVGMVAFRKHLTAAFERVVLAASNRLLHFIAADEVHRFVSKASGIEQMLSESRKFGISMIAATQSITKLPKELQDEFLTNAACKMAFRLGNPVEASTMAKLFPEATEEDLLNLNVGQAYIRMQNYCTKVQMHNFDEVHRSPAAATTTQSIKNRLWNYLQKPQITAATAAVKRDSRPPSTQIQKATPRKVKSVSTESALPPLNTPTRRPVTGPQAFCPS